MLNKLSRMCQSMQMRWLAQIYFAGELTCGEPPIYGFRGWGGSRDEGLACVQIRHDLYKVVRPWEIWREADLAAVDPHPPIIPAFDAVHTILGKVHLQKKTKNICKILNFKKPYFVVFII